MLLRRTIFAVAKTFVRKEHQLPPLPYAYDALEPVICKEIMELHHCKHHMAYVNNLNKIEPKLKCALEKGELAKAIGFFKDFQFNAGGHINHSIFWENMSPCPSSASNELCRALTSSFGCAEKFKADMIACTLSIQGSGWGWLAFNKKTKFLEVVTTASQDPLESTTCFYPLLGIDVWEHAYYIQYKNDRAEYLKAIFDVINWKDVSERYEKAKCL